jgi:hypothetical protein
LPLLNAQCPRVLHRGIVIPRLRWPISTARNEFSQLESHLEEITLEVRARLS